MQTHLASISNSEWSNQGFSHYGSPEHHSSASLLTSQSERNILALHNPTFRPTVQTVYGYTTFISENDFWKILFQVFFCPNDSLHLIPLCQYWFGPEFLFCCHFSEDFATCFTGDTGNSSRFKYRFTVMECNFFAATPILRRSRSENVSWPLFFLFFPSKLIFSIAFFIVLGSLIKTLPISWAFSPQPIIWLFFAFRCS